MRYFTGDEHYGHDARFGKGGIIYWAERPYKNIDTMANSIIRRNNEIVQDDDEVYHLGDIFWYGPERKGSTIQIMKRLKGIHHLILGNHDKLKPFDYIDIGFTSVHTSLLIEIQGLYFVLAHDPSVYIALPKNTYLLCAHIHTLFKYLPEKNVLNVGVDVWDFRPVSEDQILETMFKGVANE